MSLMITDAMFQLIAESLILDIANAEDGALVTMKVGLFTNDITPERSMVIGDFTAPTYTGYAVKSITFGSLYRRADGGWGYQGGSLQFQPTVASPVDVCFGYYMFLDSAPDVLRCAERFPVPVSLGLLTQSLTFVPEIIPVGGTDYGQVSVVNP